MYLINQTGFPIIKHPEVFEGLNGKIIANAYSLFDAKYGISYVEKEVNNRTITPTDKDVWDLIMLQWELYSDKAFNKSALYNRDFPWYNSTQLDNLYQDKNTRRQALLFLFYLPNTTWDLENQTKVFGIEGAKVSLIQADKEYQKISYYLDNPNKDVPKRYSSWYELTGERYNQWLCDRFNHGLSYTVGQYVGFTDEQVEYLKQNWSRDLFTEWYNESNGLDQYLAKNWQYWDLMKFIAGYERWNVGEINASYIQRDVFKMFGFPYWGIGIKPNPPGTPVGEWGITLPQYIVDRLEEKFGSDSIFHTPGNIFSLYACKDGLIQDGIQEVFVMIPQTTDRIYLVKES